jgi:RNA polymerase sigma factor (sigma-70 family)
MAAASLASIVSYLRSVAPPAGDDAQLLARFAAGDQTAFAALLQRYAGLVWGVCRRALPQDADAEDAFQAVWVALTRQARSLGGGPLGPWLHAVASRTAAKSRAIARRRAGNEVSPVEPAAHDPPFDDVACLLDEEVGRLPEKHRRVVVLCCLEGLTNAQAAERLGCPVGTVLSRLSRARDLLRRRLERRGVDLPEVIVGPLAAPAELIRAALAGPEQAVSAAVLSLAEGAIPNVSLHKSKLFALVLLAITFAGGAGLWACLPSANPGNRRALATAEEAKAEEKPRGKEEKKPDAKEDSKTEHAAPAVAETLNRKIDFRGFDDPKMTLGDVLEHLGDKYDVQFDVNEKAFAEDEPAADSVPFTAVRRTPIAEAEPLPAMKTSLRTVLKKVLSRVPASSGATFVIRKDHVEVTTENALRRELGLPPRKRDEFQRPAEAMTLLVWQESRKEALSEALKRIADDLDVNVVIDARVEDKAAAKVNASLRNVTVETALKLLADQAGLAVAKVENVYYVTSPENAAKLRK